MLSSKNMYRRCMKWDENCRDLTYFKIDFKRSKPFKTTKTQRTQVSSTVCPSSTKDYV